MARNVVVTKQHGTAGNDVDSIAFRLCGLVWRSVHQRIRDCPRTPTCSDYVSCWAVHSVQRIMRPQLGVHQRSCSQRKRNNDDSACDYHRSKPGAYVYGRPLRDMCRYRCVVIGVVLLRGSLCSAVHWRIHRTPLTSRTRAATTQCASTAHAGSTVQH